MKNPPAFQFYARDWLADQNVRLLTHEQRGIYIDLLSYCWENDGLPKDEGQLARLLGLPMKRFQAVAKAVLGLFTELSDCLHHPRLMDYKSLVEAKSQKAGQSAKRRWEKRDANGVRTQEEKECERNANALRTHCEGNAIIADCRVQTADAGEEKGGAGGNPAELPEGVSPQSEGVGGESEGVNPLRPAAWLAGAGATPAEEVPESARPRDELFDAIADVTGLDPSVDLNGGRIGKVKQALLAAKDPYGPEDVRLFGIIFAMLHPQKTVPTWQEVRDQIGLARRADLVKRLNSGGLPGIGVKLGNQQPGFHSRRGEQNRGTPLTPEEIEQDRRESEAMEL